MHSILYLFSSFRFLDTNPKKNSFFSQFHCFRSRAKLYRYDTAESPATWKERGTGEVKILHHKSNKTVRVVMRRDKTLKICANHFSKL